MFLFCFVCLFIYLFIYFVLGGFVFCFVLFSKWSRTWHTFSFSLTWMLLFVFNP